MSALHARSNPRLEDVFLLELVPKYERVAAFQALLADQVSAKVGRTLTLFLGGVVAPR